MKKIKNRRTATPASRQLRTAALALARALTLADVHGFKQRHRHAR